MIKTTTWHPDTCGCIFEYEWDDELDERTHEVVAHNDSNCSQHNFKIIDTAWSTIVDENCRKNIVHAQISDYIEENIPELMNTDSNGNKILKDKVFEFQYDNSGVLTINLNDVNHNHISDIQSVIDSVIEPDLVVIQ